LFDFTPKQWEMIKSGRMTRRRFTELVTKMNRNTQEKMMHEMREMVRSEEEIKQAIRAVYPALTAGDLELCAMIVKGRTTGQIARLRGVHHNSVTSQRSRLRAKLSLSPDRNLNDYLRSLAMIN
jgi:DNA-binding CsgD family transcriptional regulator